MNLQYKFKQATRFINDLCPEEYSALKNICKEIQGAENKLRINAEDLLQRCYTACEGLCCRNLDLDAVISKEDFVYLLTNASELRDTIAACLQNEVAFFTFDCIFLKNGIGPCIFPPDVRPLTCLVTFCGDETSVKKEITQVKKKFLKLYWFIIFRRIPPVRRLFFGANVIFPIS